MTGVILVIASRGYQPVEYGETKEILEKAGYTVITASDKAGEVEASDGTKAVAEISVAEVKTMSAAGLFFIGGQGTLPHLGNESSYQLLREWQKTGKPYGAICISPRILARAGVLQNKKATGWDGDGKLADIFLACGVEYVREEVVSDGKVITANGPLAAKEFGEKILKIL